MTIAKKKRYYGTMKLSAAWLITAVLILVATCANIYAYTYASRKQNILSPAFENINIQNNRVTTLNGYTYLGTYKDMVVAIDDEGNEAWTFSTSGSIEGIAVDKERGLVFAGSQGRIVYILNVADGSEAASIKVSGRIYDIDYHEGTGRILVTAPVNAAKGQVFVYDIDGTELLKLSTRPSRGVLFAPDGQSFYYCDARAAITHVSMDGEELHSAKLDKEIYSIDISDETGDIVAISDAGTLALFDSELNEKFQKNFAGDGRAASISPSGDLIGAGTREGDVYLLDANGVLQYSTRLSSAVTQIVMEAEASYVVPLSEELFKLDTDAAVGSLIYSTIREYTSYGLFTLPILFILALVLAIGRSRSAVMAFFAALNRHRVAYIFLLPSFALIIIFNYIPIGQAFYFAFTDWNQASKTMRDVNFVGFQNFVKMITEGYFLIGVKNMLIMMAFSFLKLIMPLFIAELVFSMSGDGRRYWYRFLLVLPMVVPGVVSALMWKNIYDPTIGLANQILIAIGRADLARSWLGSEYTALGSIIFMGFPWVNSFAFLVFYGGLINIPGDLFEAARVDGSNPFWNLTRIHLPLITPQIKMIIILTFIGAIQDYGGILLLTGGGPGYATYVPGYEMYLNATLLGQYGYACALGIVLFVAILAGTVVNLRIRTEELG